MLLEAEDVSKVYRQRRGGGDVHAVRTASIQARPGEFVAIVGESGSGKSTLARMLLGLIPATSGSIRLDGVALADMDRHQRRAFRTRVQAVLQDPSGSPSRRSCAG